MARVKLTSDKTAGPIVGTGSAAMELDIDFAKITSLSLFDDHMRKLRQQAAEQGLK